MEGDHLAFDQYMKKLEDDHPRYRTRLSQQTWLRVNGSTDSVLKDLQERYGKTFISFVFHPSQNVLAAAHFHGMFVWITPVAGKESDPFCRSTVLQSISRGLIIYCIVLAISV